MSERDARGVREQVAQSVDQEVFVNKWEGLSRDRRITRENEHLPHFRPVFRPAPPLPTTLTATIPAVLLIQFSGNK